MRNFAYKLMVRVAEEAHARDCPERGFPSAGLKPHSEKPLEGGFHPPAALPPGIFGQFGNWFL